MALIAGTVNVTTANVATQFSTTSITVPKYATSGLPTGVIGELAYDTTTNTLKVKTNSAWVTVGTQS